MALTSPVRSVPRTLALPRTALVALPIRGGFRLASASGYQARGLSHELMDLTLLVLLASGALVATLVSAEQSLQQGIALGAAVLLSVLGASWSARFETPAARFGLLAAALATGAVGLAALRLANDGLAAACADPYRPVCLDTGQHLATVAPVLLAAVLLAGVTAVFSIGTFAAFRGRN